MEKKKKNLEASLALAQAGTQMLPVEPQAMLATDARSSVGATAVGAVSAEGSAGGSLSSQEASTEKTLGEGASPQGSSPEEMSAGKEEKKPVSPKTSAGLMDGWIRSLLKFLGELWDYMVCTVPDWQEKVPVPQGILEGQYDPPFFAGAMELLKKKDSGRAMEEKMERWLQQEAQARELYPALDLREELKDPRFAELLDCGLDVRTAFEIIHKDQIIGASMHFVALEMERRFREGKHSPRPTENGGHHGPAVCKVDVSRMSRQERRDLIRRAQMGETIRL